MEDNFEDRARVSGHLGPLLILERVLQISVGH